MQAKKRVFIAVNLFRTIPEGTALKEFKLYAKS